MNKSWVFVPRRGLKVGFLSLRSWVFVPDFLPLSVVFQIVTLPFLRVLPSLADKKKPDNHTKHKKGTFLIILTQTLGKRTSINKKRRYMIQLINQKLGFCPYLKKPYFKKLGFCPYAFLIYCRERN